MKKTKKAVVLLSGGLDSAVTLYIAGKEGYDCHCLIFDYGQRHDKELESAKSVARSAGAVAEVVRLSLPWGGSSLTDKGIDMPMGRSVSSIKKGGIPSTYVPARNTIFLSMAASYAEAIGASSIFIGAHSEDSSGYPDCRISYLKALDKALKLGTRAGSKGTLKLEFPLIKKSKSAIIKTGVSLGVPFELTWSCYKGGALPCMKCDSCILRAKGFKEALMRDPALNAEKAAITEVFSSLQGEGILVGARQIFVRFKDCNMNCGFCDTPAETPAKEYSPDMLLREVRALDIKQGPHHSVSLTGGEPLLHAAFLKKFLPLLKKDMFRIYLETNGTLPGELARVIDLVDMVAMDLKLPSSTDCGDFWDKHERFLKAARAKKVFVKAVVTADTKKSDIARAIALVKKIDASIPFVIQPATPVNRSDEVVPQNRLHEFFDMTVKSGVADARIMPQVHKILGIK